MSSIAVIIPALNAAETLPHQLEALANQEGADPFEVLVCDNGSTDGTPGLVTIWADRLNIRLVDASDAKGAAHARNRGALAATAEMLLFCDADDYVSPNWVKRMSDTLAEDGVVVAGPVLWITDETPVGYIPVDGRNLSNCDEYVPYMGFLPCILAGSLGIRRSDFLAIGGFDNSYGAGCEDVDFSWRAQLHGLEVRVARESILYYRPRTGTGARFRQARGYTSASILLWQRFRDQPGITGKSLKWTLMALSKALARAPRQLFTSRESREQWAADVGSHLGSLEGHLRFRRSVPARQLLKLGQSAIEPRNEVHTRPLRHDQGGH